MKVFIRRDEYGGYVVNVYTTREKAEAKTICITPHEELVIEEWEVLS